MAIVSCFRPLALVVAGALALTSLTGCDKDVVLKTLNVNLTSDIVLDVSATDPLAGTYTEELDPNANVDVRDNRSKIKKVVVERLAYRVRDFPASGTPGTKASGTWEFYLSDTPAQRYALGTVSNIDLKALSDAGTVQELTIADEGKNALVEAVNSGRKVTLVFNGTVSTKPTFARFEVQVFTKIDIGA